MTSWECSGCSWQQPRAAVVPKDPAAGNSPASLCPCAGSRGAMVASQPVLSEQPTLPQLPPAQRDPSAQGGTSSTEQPGQAGSSGRVNACSGTLNPACPTPPLCQGPPHPPPPCHFLPSWGCSVPIRPQEHTARCTKRAFLPPGTQREWTFALENGATKALAQAEECVAALQPHVNGACAQNTKGGEEAEPLWW